MIWNIDPVLLSLGPLEIRYYGLFFAASLLFAYLLGQKMVKARGLSLEAFDSLMTHGIIGVVIGARLGHIVFYELSTYLANPLQILKVWEGGLASHGGAIGVIVAFLIFKWSKPKLLHLKYADILAVLAAFPIGMVRLGNFFNSEIVGRAWDGPWSVVFPRVDQIARHPSQLYEFMIGAILLAILYPAWKRKPAAGSMVGLVISLYFPMRFLVEFFKEYPLHENFFNLTTGQILSIPFTLVGIAILLWTKSKKCEEEVAKRA